MVFFIYYLLLLGIVALLCICCFYKSCCEQSYAQNCKKKYKIISLDGNIGAGKTTLLKILNSYIIKYNIKNISIIEEPVHIWESTGILKKFYENKKQNAGFFQLFVLETILHAIKDKMYSTMYSNIYSTQIIITERSLDSTKWVFAQMLYDDGDISYEAMESYLYIYNKIDKLYLPSATIYLNTDPNTCDERIVKRNRDGEIISNEYLIKCDRYYKNMINIIKQSSPVLEINGNNNADIYKQILNFIHSV